MGKKRVDRNAYHYVLKANADPRLWPTELPVNYRYYLFTDRERPFAKPDSWNYVNPITNSTSRVAASVTPLRRSVSLSRQPARS